MEDAGMGQQDKIEKKASHGGTHGFTQIHHQGLPWLLPRHGGETGPRKPEERSRNKTKEAGPHEDYPDHCKRPDHFPRGYRPDDSGGSDPQDRYRQKQPEQRQHHRQKAGMAGQSHAAASTDRASQGGPEQPGSKDQSDRQFVAVKEHQEFSENDDLTCGGDKPAGGYDGKKKQQFPRYSALFNHDP